MVFGIHSGKAPPQLDENGHYLDPNMPASYEIGPASRAYISDPTHPDYDPGIDPNLQLRSVRTAAESIAESHRSEARRELRQKAKRKASILGRLGRGRTLNRGKSTKGRKPGTAAIAELVQDELSRLRDEQGNEQTGAQGSGGEGVGVAFDSAQQYDTPFSPTADLAGAAEEAAKEEAKLSGADLDQGMKKGKKKPAKRRNVYLNIAPTSLQEVDKRGEPFARYPRNKVRTSKYTIVTFLPRFLSEQFRRLANVYFLFLVLLQTSTLFGATVPQIAMLPLVAILGITAIKDSLEDYRRHILDNQVNNSAVTRLGNWRNVNQPTDTRTWLTKHFRKNRPAKVSKGVKKLREKEDAIGMGPIRGSTSREAKEKLYEGGTGMERQSSARTRSDSLHSRPGQYLETIASESEHPNNSTAKLAMTSSNKLVGQSTTSLDQRPDDSRISLPDVLGVVDYRRSTRGTARWERTLWKKLEVGDVILLRENEQVPADLVLLNSSDPDGNAFVETKNLDGETNLKVKKCVKSTMSIQSEEDVEHARFVIDSEPPHANLYSYSALLKFERASTGPSASEESPVVVEPVTANELLLRGCALRNTEWVIGIVVFTGKDTKILLNGGDTPSKRSKIEKETNVNVAVNFGFLLVMCAACAVVGGLLLNGSDDSRNFYEPGSENSSSNVVNALIIFGCCLVLFQNIVPISLYISIELTKTISAYFIYQDIDMYYEPLDHPCVPKTWGIVDDLGQIEYIFSDKTGTLTQNVMEFKKCSINGISYGEGITEAMIGSMKRQGKDTSGTDPEEQRAQLEGVKEQMIAKLNQTFKNRYLRPDKVTLISTGLSDAIASRTEVDQRQKVIIFFRALALCHTALADRMDSANPFIVEYKAQSPDEAALVSAARDIGAVFINKNNHVVDIEVMGQPERYTPLKVLEFNSTRKRMSVIVRDIEGRILLICKGADSVIYQKLRPDHPEELKKTTQRDLEDFANAGLRTLCIAQRYLEEGEYLEWSRLHDEAAASLTDRDDAVDEACEQIEHSLTLLGATALEDKLQVGVPETIEKLHQAGIKLWILTGDKLQTAIEIGFSCNLLSSDMEIMIISADHEQGTRAQLEAACNKIAASGRPVVVRGKQRGMFKKSSKQEFSGEGVVNDKSQFAVVVDGETLKFCLDKSLKPLFLALTTQCETVICCRVSPAQKALTVRLVKEGMDCMTLAIGDGANDVSMIQEAHVGVGIAGLEGAQASMSADYAIGQFRFLAKLLLVHGHWNTYRMGVLHQVFFYKNIIWTFSLLLFQIFCQANATYLFDYSLVLLYNLIFTSLPVIMLGSLDQDLRAPALMSFPQTYAPGRKGQLYSRSQFWFACVDGVYQSIVCFMIPTAAYYWFPIVSSKGFTLDPLTELGCTIGASCVLSANLYCGLMLQNWSVIIWLVIIFSNLSYFIWITIYSAPLFDSTFTSTAFELYASVQFWTVVLLSIVLSLLPRYTWNAWSSSFRPSQGDIVRQGWVKGDLKQQLGIRPGGEKSISESNLEAGQSNGALHQSYNEGYDEPRSYDPALRDFEGISSPSSPTNIKRNTLGAREAGIMGRSLESSFSFYDPDTLPANYTPEVDRSPQLSRHPIEEESQRGDETYSYSEYQHDPQSNLPQINIQRASYNSNHPYPSTSSSMEGRPITSRTALASTSIDSFEDQFQDAFADRTPPRKIQQHHQHSAQSAVDDSPTSPQRYHSRFNQSTSSSFRHDDSGGTEDLTTPPRPLTDAQRQDSEADGFYTPTDKGSRNVSSGSTAF